MAKIKFNVKIKDVDFDSYYIILEGQDLYFFNRRSQEGKEMWIKSHLETRIKISNIVIE